MKVKVYQSENDEYTEMESIGKIKYVGESFGIDGLIRVIDDSGEDYLYSISNPRPIDGSSKGGKWLIVKDYSGKLNTIGVR